MIFPVVGKKRKKKFGAELKWAIAHLSISIGSRYSHCIVTQRLEDWPDLGGGKLCHDTTFVS